MVRAVNIVVGFLLAAAGGGLLAFPDVLAMPATGLRVALEGLALLLGFGLLVLGFRSGLEPHIQGRVRLKIFARRGPTVIAGAAVASAAGLEVLVARQVTPAGALFFAATLVLVALLASAGSLIYACRQCGSKLTRHAIPTNDVAAVRNAVNRADPTAIGGLVALASEGPGKGLAGIAEMEVEWCRTCRRAARVAFEGGTCWFVDGDAGAIVRTIR
jgi:hypothetical protein